MAIVLKITSIYLSILWLQIMAATGTNSTRYENKSENVSYLNYKLYELSCRNDHCSKKILELQKLADREFIDIWSLPMNNQSGYVLTSPEFESSLLAVLKEDHINYMKINDNWQQTLDIQTAFALKKRTKGKLHTYFMSYSQIEKRLSIWAKKFSSLCKLDIIGFSSEERKIFLFKISRNSSYPIIWLDAGIHAREWISISSSIYVIDKILHRNAISDQLLSQYQLYVVPLVNPDGYEYSRTKDRMWRKNRKKYDKCFGVDLNRNFMYKWGGKGASRFACSDIYRGPTPMSESETMALSRTLFVIRSQVKLFLTTHSFGQFIFTPFGYSATEFPSNYYDLVVAANIVSHNLYEQFGVTYKYGSSSNLMYVASGGSEDFAMGQLKIPFAFTIELPDKGLFGFEMPPPKIKLIGIQMLQMIVDFSKNIYKI